MLVNPGARNLCLPAGMRYSGWFDVSRLLNIAFAFDPLAYDMLSLPFVIALSLTSCPS
jgi:hypothetical protein